MILVAENIGEDSILVLAGVLDQTHSDTCYRLLDRHAGIHEGECTAADAGHRRRAVRLENVGDYTHGVRIVLWDLTLEGTPGEMAVANLTTAGTALALSLTGRERWEVVVEHETLIAACHHTVDHLLVELCAEGDRSERHGLTALEDSTSVGHRQRAHLAPDRTHLVGLTAIHAEALVEDAAAHSIAQHIVPVAAGLGVLLLEILLREICVSSVVLLEEVG